MSGIKGIVLAGGLGRRLDPLTKVTNKHLLPVYDKPMIYYPLETLANAGIQDVMIVTGGTSPGDFMRLLGNGKKFGFKSLSFTYQEGEGGIAHALALTKRFTGKGKVIVILGDNIIEDSIAQFVKKFKIQKTGARILLKKISDAHRFGVAELKNGKVVRIVEKPKKPKSNLAVTGIYFYDSSVYDVIKTLKPSRRGELEITDVNNAYIRQNNLEYNILKGYWTDAGTFDSLIHANELACQTKGKKK